MTPTGDGVRSVRLLEGPVEGGEGGREARREACRAIIREAVTPGSRAFHLGLYNTYCNFRKKS
jgi:hypothetical protein